MDSREKEKSSTLKAILGIILIFMGVISLISGEQIPGDPDTILPTCGSIAIGFLLIALGFFIGKNHFKAIFHEEDKSF